MGKIPGKKWSYFEVNINDHAKLNLLLEDEIDKSEHEIKIN